MSIRCDSHRAERYDVSADDECSLCLRAKVADLTRRIRLARKDLPAVGLDDGGAFDRCVAALDLRMPLSRRTRRKP